MRFIRWLCSRFKRTPKVKKAPFKATFDSRTEKNLATLDPGVQDEMRRFVTLAKKVASRFGMTFKVISGMRTAEEQQRLWNIGRKTPGKIVTKAKPWTSSHNYGTAIDGALFDGDIYLDGKDSKLSTKIYKVIANNAKADGLNIEAGIHWKSFPDPPHFEYITGRSMAEMKQRIQKGHSVV